MKKILLFVSIFICFNSFSQIHNQLIGRDVRATQSFIMGSVGRILNSSGMAIRGGVGASLFLGSNDDNKWGINTAGELFQATAGDLGAYTFQNTTGQALFQDIVLNEQSAPSTPASGKGVLYADISDGHVKWKDDAGTVYDLTTAGSDISLTTTGTSGVATLVGNVLNIPNYSGGSTTWSGVFGGTTSTTSALTIGCGGSVQWIFTGSSTVAWTLPAMGSCGNRAYFFKNEGTADLTVQRGGSDELYTNAVVTSITIKPGESRMVASGVTYWHVHNISSVPNLSWDAGNHEVDIDGGGTSAVIPLATSSANGLATPNQVIGTIGTAADGMGSVITTGSKGFITIPYNATITNWYVACNASGSIQFDVKRSGTSIVGGGGNKPLVSSAQNGNAAVSGWTSTSITAGDIIEWNVDSATTVVYCSCTLKVIK